MALVNPHFDLPFRFTSTTGKPAEVEQGSLAEVVNCVQAVVRYHKGDREVLPEFGIQDPTFTTGDIDLEAIKSEIDKWEPRAKVVLSEAYSSYDEGIRTILLEAGIKNG